MTDKLKNRLAMVRREFLAEEHVFSLEHDLYDVAVAQGAELERLDTEQRSAMDRLSRAIRRQVGDADSMADCVGYVEAELERLRAENERLTRELAAEKALHIETRNVLAQSGAERASQAERIRYLEREIDARHDPLHKHDPHCWACAAHSKPGG